jgi:hypothetical protein
MAAKWGYSVLLCMPYRTKWILCMAVKWGPDVLLCMPNRTKYILCMAAKWGRSVLCACRIGPCVSYSFSDMHFLRITDLLPDAQRVSLSS